MRKPNPTDSLYDEAIDWLLRLREPDCSEAERQAFESWLAQGADRRALYEQLAREWDRLDRFQRLDFPVRQAALSYRPAAQRSVWPLALAASVLLATGLTAFSPHGWYGTSHSYATTVGGSEHIELDDGSVIELNTDSEVNVRLNRWRRSVELLKGEAYFTVNHDEQRPFTVRAGPGRTVDIGTAFDIYRQPGKVTVAVEEGVVRVEAGSSTELAASQSISYDDQGRLLATGRSPVDNLTSWRRGQLVFENRRLDEVLTEFSRYHTTRIRLGDPALAQLRVSGRFHLARLDTALETIALTLPVVPKRTNAHEVVLLQR